MISDHLLYDYINKFKNKINKVLIIVLIETYNKKRNKILFSNNYTVIEI